MNLLPIKYKPHKADALIDTYAKINDYILYTADPDFEGVEGVLVLE